jgi:hypothetical protein
MEAIATKMSAARSFWAQDSNIHPMNFTVGIGRADLRPPATKARSTAVAQKQF